LTDVVILAKDTCQVAVGEKYRARAKSSYQNFFFSEVRSEAANGGISSRLAKALFVFKAIYVTLPWTQFAIRRNF
jgi:putative protein kinase ArgK-like GTPase of G3E family